MPKYKRLQRLLYHPCSYTANTSKQHTELYMGFSCDYTRSTDHDTRPAQAVIIPLAQSWSVSQRRNTSSAYQIPASCRTLYRSVQPPYYNKVYKSAADCKQCQPGGGQRLHLCRVIPAACDLAPASSHGAPAGTFYPAGQSSGRSAAGGAEPLAATAATLFGLSPDSQ